MVRNPLPQLTLALLLAVASSIVLGGAWLARRTERERVVKDREPLRQFAAMIADQTRQLETIYENHLRRIVETAEPRNLAASRSVAERLVGLRQISLLRADGERERDQHLVLIKPTPGAPWPEPTFREQPGGLPRPLLRLPQTAILGEQPTPARWMDRPGQPLIFWQRRETDNSAFVLVVERASVGAVMEEWLRAWLASEGGATLAAVAASGGSDRLLGLQGAVLSLAGPPPAEPERPDFLIPLRTHFGTWQLSSWDRIETRTSYHTPTLLIAGVLGVGTALLGIAIFAQQRRAGALAAQRVSFVNRVSHELRTPLTNMLLNLDLTTESLAQTGQPPRRLAVVREEAGRLGRLIDNVLTFSRQEEGKLYAKPRPCVPDSVIDDVLEQFAPSLERRALAVRRQAQAQETCLLDADAFAQILANLLSNVEKYVPGGVVEIASTLAEGVLGVTVVDEGPGIPARDAERIFRPFERLGSLVNEGASGTGLGLAIARDLAADMGGSLRLRPVPRGACFELIVPAPPASSLCVAV